jgi:L-lactate dehydrogenase complex protein LldF
MLKTDMAKGTYQTVARRAIADPVLQTALKNLQERFGKGTAAAYRMLPEGPGLRQVAHAIRMETIDNLDVVLTRLIETVTRNGGRVFLAENGRAAVDYCLRVARRHDVKRVVKGKSMVTEEIGLNRALEEEGIAVTEADLGEYIIQLAGEHPSHIIAPAIHKTRRGIGKLFASRLGIPFTDDPPTLTQAARQALRQQFFAADMGVTGCNLACAETGHITTVSNEGNIRMAATMPKIHMAFMGMERVVARLEDYDVLFRLLTRAAAVQNMATYVSYIGGPATADQIDGPQEMHLVIIDNGRTRILADQHFREMLCCIRCAACLNVCPVYGEIGGHAYGSVYSGPVGAVVTPLLSGMQANSDLCKGETLCGACQAACPVDIDLPRMLLELRAKLAEGDPKWHVVRSAGLERIGYHFWSWMIGSRRRYDLFLTLAAAAQKLLPQKAGMLRRLPPPFNGWTSSRDLRPLASESFGDYWRRKHK